MYNEELRLTDQLAHLHLSFIRENHQTLAAQAAREQWTHQQYLRRLIEGESLRRQDRSIARRIAAARFPFIKTLDQFDWTWPKKINRPQVQHLFGLGFLKEKANITFIGGVCFGKSHLSIAILITGKTPLGYDAIVENAHRGLLYHNNLAAPLTVGAKLKGFVRTVRPGGKIDLSLDASGYQRVASLTEQIVEALKTNGGRLDFDDDSSPEAIRQTFSVSKKAFKQALGKLYKARRIGFQKPGIQLLDNSSWLPGA